MRLGCLFLLGEGEVDGRRSLEYGASGTTVRGRHGALVPFGGGAGGTCTRERIAFLHKFWASKTKNAYL